MKAVVLIKRVPDTASIIKISPDKKSIDLSGLNFVINPYDEYALENAIRLKENKVFETLSVCSVGPPQTVTILRNALAMGADNAYLIKDNSNTVDPFVIANNLATFLQENKFDVIFTGKQGVDSDFAQTGLLISALVNIPILNHVLLAEFKDNVFVIKKEGDAIQQVFHAFPPFILSYTKCEFEPRYPSLKGIMMAKTKPLKEIEAKEYESKLEIVEVQPPPPRPPGKIVGKGVEAVGTLVKLLREEAKVI